MSEPESTVPYGYCHCGCGQKTSIAKRNEPDKGWTKGEPVRYLHHHHLSPPKPIEDRYWAKVDKRGPDECWEWTAACYPHTGYGMFFDGKSPSNAHRYAVFLDRGPIPEGMVVDHLCRNRKCVNPAHLEVVTPEINTLRAYVDRFSHLCCDDCRRRLREEASWT